MKIYYKVIPGDPTGSTPGSVSSRAFPSYVLVDENGEEIENAYILNIAGSSSSGQAIATIAISPAPTPDGKS